MLGSVSGTAPGFSVDGVSVALNLDPYTDLLLGGGAPLAPSAGFLPPGGGQAVLFTLPAGSSPGLVGLTAHHAYVLIGIPELEVTFASDPVSLDFVP